MPATSRSTGRDSSITLDDGTIAFTQDAAGKVTGAFFEGDGEVLLLPPNQAERGSMALFTGSAILEEHFVNGYFRFNDDTFTELQPYLRTTDNGSAFIAQWGEMARTLAQIDALRLFMTFSRVLPIGGKPAPLLAADNTAADDRFLHARDRRDRSREYSMSTTTRTLRKQVWNWPIPHGRRLQLLPCLEFVLAAGK